MGLFDKKYCDICGEKIGLLGNRKLENGNLCKNCAKKLSPWFSDRRNSTVEEIKAQLAYREAYRVIRLSASSVCLCCGDAQWEGEQVDEAQIIAYVTAFRRKGRWRETALSRPYRLYEHFWVHTFPARRPLLRLLRFLQRARRGLIRGRR